MKLNFFNRFTVSLERKKSNKHIPITQSDVEVAIVSLYDEYTLEHGSWGKSVYFIATKSQVAKLLGVGAHRIDPVINTRYGYAKFKEEVLVKNGRGSFVPWTHGFFFRPNDLSPPIEIIDQ